MTAEEQIAVSQRKFSLTAGVLYLLTFVSIPTLALYSSIHSPDYIINSGSDNQVFIGVILEIIVALAGIGTAVALYPVIKRQNEMLALGLVSSRILEASTIFAGAASLLTLVSLKQSQTGEDGLITANTLITFYDRFFFVGQSLMPAVNDLLLGYLLYKSRLVPRSLALIGLVGAPLLICGDLGILYGIIEQRGETAALTAVLVALFEFSLGIWLVVKGFNTSAPILNADAGMVEK